MPRKHAFVISLLVAAALVAGAFAAIRTPGIGASTDPSATSEPSSPRISQRDRRLDQIAADTRGHARGPSSNRSGEPEPGDDHGDHLEPGDDHGNHFEPGDDHGGDDDGHHGGHSDSAHDGPGPGGGGGGHDGSDD